MAEGFRRRLLAGLKGSRAARLLRQQRRALTAADFDRLVAAAMKRRRMELGLPLNPELDVPIFPPPRDHGLPDNETPLAAPFLGPYR